MKYRLCSVKSRYAFTVTSLKWKNLKAIWRLKFDVLVACIPQISEELIKTWKVKGCVKYIIIWLTLLPNTQVARRTAYILSKTL